jgi:hypothetical protein
MNVFQTIDIYKSGIYNNDLDESINLDNIKNYDENCDKIICEWKDNNSNKIIKICCHGKCNNHSNFFKKDEHKDILSNRIYGILYILNICNQHKSLYDISIILQHKKNDFDFVNKFLHSLQHNFSIELLNKLHPFFLFSYKKKNIIEDFETDKLFYNNEECTNMLNNLEYINLHKDFKIKLHNHLLNLIENNTNLDQLKQIYELDNLLLLE